MRKYIVQARILVEASHDDFNREDAWIAAQFIQGLSLPVSQERHAEITITVEHIEEDGIIRMNIDGTYDDV